MPRDALDDTARPSRPSPTPAESLRRALVHLRLGFSLILTPLFLWGVYLALPGSLRWGRLFAGYLLVHVFHYGGMNSFNSYYDRDEGPIGALLDPPPVDRFLLVVAIAFKLAALAGGLFLDPRFGAYISLAILLSVLYSHPRTRWKERPALAAVCIFVGQGVLGVLWGWTAATAAGAGFWPPGSLASLGVASAACWTLGMYPLTGAYQIEGDRARGIRTLAVCLGLPGSFRFASIVTPLGGLGTALVLATRGAMVHLALMALYFVVAAFGVRRWYRAFGSTTIRENQRELMRLSYRNGLVFTTLFLTLIIG